MSAKNFLRNAEKDHASRLTISLIIAASCPTSVAISVVVLTDWLSMMTALGVDFFWQCLINWLLLVFLAPIPIDVRKTVNISRPLVKLG